MFFERRKNYEKYSFTSTLVSSMSIKPLFTFLVAISETPDFVSKHYMESNSAASGTSSYNTKEYLSHRFGTPNLLWLFAHM